MFKKLLVALLTSSLCISVLSSCGKSTTEVEDKVEEKAEEVISENIEDVKEEAKEEASEELSIDGLDELKVIGDVDVDKNLFDVTLTVPKDFIGETTQEELDKTVAEKEYKSATLNDDGSVTYVMTKAQHKELLDAVSQKIDESMAEMIGAEQTPNITDVQANSDYTKFTITTKSTELGLGESFSVLAFYTYGGMYGVFSGERPDNIQVEFINADTGEVINTANSKDAG